MGSAEVFARYLVERMSVNMQIMKNPYWYLPVDDVGHEEFVPVGRGVKSSVLCGKWVSISVCDNIEGHKGKSLHGVDCTGKLIARHNHLWCTNSLCPVCFIRGWSVRGARNIDRRLVVGVERGFGKIEHVVVSVPVAERGLSESVLRKRCRNALFDRGVVGGCMIWHGYRVDEKRGVLVWSPHYHILGFIGGDGGFDRCRDCVHVREDCYSCDGFKGRESRGFKNDGYLVKVLGERKTIIGSAHYQLHHATVRVGLRRFHCVTWFGCCGNRKFKSEKSMVEIKCPVCGEEMIKRIYIGKRHLIKDIGDVDYQSCFVIAEFDEDGNPNFMDAGG